MLDYQEGTPEMAGKQEIEEAQGKSLLNKDGSVTKLMEWATEHASTPEEMLDLFMSEGVEVSAGEEITGDYKVVHGEEKVAFLRRMLGQRLMVVEWQFYNGDAGNEFVAMHIIWNAGKFILNDSAQTGMYGQLRRITDAREEKDDKAAAKRTSTVGLMVARGVREAKAFYYDTRTKKAIKKDELDNVPQEFKALSKPTFQFDL